jgi:hypothetical protein
MQMVAAIVLGQHAVWVFRIANRLIEIYDSIEGFAVTDLPKGLVLEEQLGGLHLRWIGEGRSGTGAPGGDPVHLGVSGDNREG